MSGTPWMVARAPKSAMSNPAFFQGEDSVKPPNFTLHYFLLAKAGHGSDLPKSPPNGRPRWAVQEVSYKFFQNADFGARSGRTNTQRGEGALERLFMHTEPIAEVVVLIAV